MAEEIISSWESVGRLVAELGNDEDEQRRTRSRMRETEEPLTFEFEIRDGNGNEIVWPLTLISDTSVRTEEIQGVGYYFSGSVGSRVFHWHSDCSQGSRISSPWVGGPPEERTPCLICRGMDRRGR